jgi:hypothetical protein
MRSKIIGRKKAFIPWFKEFPYEETKKWGAALRDNIPKTIEGMLKRVPDPETFRKKIGNKALAGVQRMLRDDFVSRSGLTKKQIIRRMKKKFQDPVTAERYQKNIKYAFETFDQDALNSAMADYQLGRSFGDYRFKPAMELVLDWVIGNPIIQPKKQGKFRVALGNQLLSSGKLISKSNYAPDIIKQENDKINRLINKYIRKRIIRFSAGGHLPARTGIQAGSHCDFVLIPESITLADSTKAREIEYKSYSFFLGEEKAKKLRATWIEKDYPAKPDPNEYLGTDQKVYFDMFLDISVAASTANESTNRDAPT